MQKIIITIFFTGLFIAICSFPAAAFQEWEASLTITSGTAESRLSFGQKPDATDLSDGLYDVPAMLSGNIQAYFQTGDESLWRDIRETGPEMDWRLIITSQNGLPVSITWNPARLPVDAEVKLLDTSNEKVTDMKISSVYSLGNTSNALLLIEVTSN